MLQLRISVNKKPGTSTNMYVAICAALTAQNAHATLTAQNVHAIAYSDLREEVGGRREEE
jgi:hypothetical protein